ncbi:major facilitator superfamily domain-containing protein [Russula earlei]|uniref:Major facilitator superfamily domain-containing protein n=1 Tax=Russula earlei TaxID=71964 RepID=A0ACC0U9P4_9AGAM|nr:major facilitator superfamily domain-containing protein [Russula earlei]
MPRYISGETAVHSPHTFPPMSFQLEEAGNCEQSAGPQLQITETAVGISEYNVAADKQYSVFTHREKWLIVSIASFAALFSPLTANIYFPAIPVISREFHKSVELINLTVTMYMILQGISPMVWGTLSDRLGRRPIMFACLTTLSLSCVGLALVPTSAYWLLMLLRCLQAAGSASTVAIGAGIIADICAPAERGGFFGIFGLGPLVGPAFGPVIGGALDQGLGWRAIFWFLCICSAICGLGLFLFLPETLRAIVGDGSISAGWIYMPSIPIIGRHRKMKESNERPPRKSFTNPLLMFAYPDVFVLLLFNGTCYAVMYGVTASLSVIFEKNYPHLTQTDIGLCFLPIGGGMVLGTWASGRFLDAHFRKIRNDLILQARTKSVEDVDPNALQKDPSFPIETARLQAFPYIIFVYVACVIGFGWSLHWRVTIAVPLILQFIIGLAAIAIMNPIQTLLVDLVPIQGSSITACNNIVRCTMGAGMVSIINPILVALGNGWAYTLLGGLCVLVSPLLYIDVRWGPMWRERRRIKEQQDTLRR